MVCAVSDMCPPFFTSEVGKGGRHPAVIMDLTIHGIVNNTFFDLAKGPAHGEIITNTRLFACYPQLKQVNELRKVFPQSRNALSETWT
jgi:hypothetical protein